MNTCMYICLYIHMSLLVAGLAGERRQPRGADQTRRNSGGFTLVALVFLGLLPPLRLLLHFLLLHIARTPRWPCGLLMGSFVVGMCHADHALCSSNLHRRRVMRRQTARIDVGEAAPLPTPTSFAGTQTGQSEASAGWRAATPQECVYGRGRPCAMGHGVAASQTVDGVLCAPPHHRNPCFTATCKEEALKQFRARHDCSTVGRKSGQGPRPNRQQEATSYAEVLEIVVVSEFGVCCQSPSEQCVWGILNFGSTGLWCLVPVTATGLLPMCRDVETQGGCAVHLPWLASRTLVHAGALVDERARRGGLQVVARKCR